MINLKNPATCSKINVKNVTFVELLIVMILRKKYLVVDMFKIIKYQNVNYLNNIKNVNLIVKTIFVFIKKVKELFSSHKINAKIMKFFKSKILMKSDL